MKIKAYKLHQGNCLTLLPTIEYWSAIRAINLKWLSYSLTIQIYK